MAAQATREQPIPPAVNDKSGSISNELAYYGCVSGPNRSVFGRRPNPAVNEQALRSHEQAERRLAFD